MAIVAVILICVRQTFAASSQSTFSTGTIDPFTTNMILPSLFDWSYTGTVNGDDMGYSVSGAGDVNGDGFDDIIIGSPLYTKDIYREGVSFVFYGAMQGLRSTPDWMIGSGLQGCRFGNSVSSAGDVNGDGFDDVIIAAEDYKVNFGMSGEPKSGSVFLYYGSAEGLLETPAWQILAETPEITLGHAVSSAGDINGDGYDDVIVGAPKYESEAGQDNEGKVYLYLGGSAGLSPLPDWTYECNQPTASCGNSLGSAGDINGDGYDDILVGAPHFDGDFDQEGAAYLFLGSSSGLSTTPDWQIRGNQTGSELGSAVAGAGDVNDDGHDDIVVGASRYSQEEGVHNGAAFGFYGSPSGLSTLRNWETYGAEADAMYGASLDGAGDIDQDGYGDVIIGAYLYGTHGSVDTQPDEGAIYLFRGSAAGLETVPHWMVASGKAESWFGFAAGIAGDIDRNGVDDIIVGAPLYKADLKTLIGSAFAYYAHGAPQEYRGFLPLILSQDAE
jgi:hypothetical protein